MNEGGKEERRQGKRTSFTEMTSALSRFHIEMKVTKYVNFYFYCLSLYLPLFLRVWPYFFSHFPFTLSVISFSVSILF